MPRVSFVMAAFNVVVPYVLFTYAYDNASAGFVSLFAALIPLTTALFAASMLADEPLSRHKLVGLLTGFAGVGALLLSGDSGLESGGRPLFAAVLAIISVASVGYASAYAKRHALPSTDSPNSWQASSDGTRRSSCCSGGWPWTRLARPRTGRSCDCSIDAVGVPTHCVSSTNASRPSNASSVPRRTPKPSLCATRSSVRARP